MKLSHFIKEEKSGVKDYEKAERSGGLAKKTYKKIIPDEKKHIKELEETKEKMAKKM